MDELRRVLPLSSMWYMSIHGLKGPRYSEIAHMSMFLSGVEREVAGDVQHGLQGCPERSFERHADHGRDGAAAFNETAGSCL